MSGTLKDEGCLPRAWGLGILGLGFRSVNYQLLKNPENVKTILPYEGQYRDDDFFMLLGFLSK